MGIQRLVSSLCRFANTETLCNKEVVIDGPGFAHHVHYLCLSAESKARNPLEAAPSYDVLGTVAIAWLDALKTNNVSIRKIYFDGALPPAKRDVRVSRLISYTQQLSQYHKNYPTPYRVASANQDLELGVEVLFSRRNVPSRLTTLPAVPLLVPAVLEALLASERYKGITEVVPGEADLYCAQSVNNDGGVVLTGDSDLLIHGLGEKGAVMFFRDIEAVQIDGSESLRSPLFEPSAIVSRLGLPKSHGLHALAFELSLNGKKSFPQLLAQAKDLEAIKAYPEKYEAFEKEYHCSLGLPSAEAEDFETLRVLRTLEPRVSEFALQFKFLAGIAGQSSQNHSFDTAPHIFLPFLIDCPIRTNAWEISMSVRQLAYGLVNLIAPKNQQKRTVFEHKRQEGKSGGRELQLPNIAQIPEACNNLVILLEQLAAKLPMLSEKEVWIAVAVYQDFDWAHQNSKAVISQLVTAKPLVSEKEIDLNWDIVQLHAQILGSYQSFRIFKQLSSLVLSRNDANSLPPAIRKLYLRLETLPALSDIQDLHHAISLIQKIRNTVPQCRKMSTNNLMSLKTYKPSSYIYLGPKYLNLSLPVSSFTPCVRVQCSENSYHRKSFENDWNWSCDIGRSAKLEVEYRDKKEKQHAEHRAQIKAQIEAEGDVLFRRFNHLDQSLRNKIWKLALPDPIVHEVRFQKGIDIGGDWDGVSYPTLAPHPVLLRVCQESRAVALRYYTPFLDREPRYLPLGEKLEVDSEYSTDDWGEWDGLITSEDTPGFGTYNFKNDGGEANKEMVRIPFVKRNYIDLKNDSIYFSLKAISWLSPSDHPSMQSVFERLYDEHLNIPLDEQECAKVQHLAVDWEIFNHERFWPARGMEGKFEPLQKFLSLKTLTLVITDNEKATEFEYSHVRADQFPREGRITFAEEPNFEPLPHDRDDRSLLIVKLKLRHRTSHDGQMIRFEKFKKPVEQEIEDLFADESYRDWKRPMIVWRFIERDEKVW
ncbi:hypothetical protein G7Y89_g2110 [Cudoniella acicularis]|uniref:Asteroid domain-containing protein n=1 Tax=Cudoniella acicularis TaxID=354080 RepID=A0A8H4W9N2_9HELO|nr:hypothetical protein G7Y89_g2110 [Cudoniella acicularis]